MGGDFKFEQNGMTTVKGALCWDSMKEPGNREAPTDNLDGPFEAGSVNLTTIRSNKGNLNVSIDFIFFIISS